MTAPRQHDPGEPGAREHTNLLRHLASTIVWREGLRQITGIDDPISSTTAEEGEPYRASHSRLIADLDVAIQSRNALSDVLDLEGGYAGLIHDLGASMDTDAGLGEILASGTRHDPDVGAQPSAESADGDEDIATESSTTIALVEDDLVTILQAPAPQRLALRADSTCRALRNAQRSLDEIGSTIERMSEGPDWSPNDLEEVTAALLRQRNLVAELTAALAHALPGGVSPSAERNVAAGPLRQDDDDSAPAASGRALAALAEALREARARAGNPSYRMIARRVRYSSSSISRAFSGKVLPSWELIRQLGDVLEVPPARIDGEWRASWEAARLLRDSQPRAVDTIRSSTEVPLTAPDDGAALELRERLRLAHHQAGRPTLREVAAAIHYSKNTVSMALSGQKLPAWPLVQALGTAFNVTEDVLRGEWYPLWKAAGVIRAEEAARRADEAGLHWTTSALLGEWTDLMHRARMAAGSPSLREISQATGLSRTTLSNVLRGQKVPSWEYAVAIGTALRVPRHTIDTEWRGLWERLHDSRQPVEQPPPAPVAPREVPVASDEPEAADSAGGDNAEAPIGRDGVFQAAVLARQVARELQGLRSHVLSRSVAAASPRQLRRCAAATHDLAQLLELTWSVLSDFRGADLRQVSAAVWEDLDGVRWSDGTAEFSVTEWSEELQERVRAYSEPVEGLRGIHEIQFRAAVPTGR